MLAKALITTMDTTMKTHLFRITCLVIAAYHLLIGIVATFAPAAASKLAPLMYGVSLEALGAMKPEYAIVIRFIGAFALALGIMAAFAAARPHGSAGIVLGIIAFFVVRIFDRIVWAASLHDAFNVSTARNYVQIALMVLFVIVLAVCLPRRRET